MFCLKGNSSFLNQYKDENNTNIRSTHFPCAIKLFIFSFPGGQLGLWVGISAITLCEIFGFLSLSIRHACKCSKSEEKSEDVETTETNEVIAKML